MVTLEVYEGGRLVERREYEDVRALETACWQNRWVIFERSERTVRARKG